MDLKELYGLPGFQDIFSAVTNSIFKHLVVNNNGADQTALMPLWFAYCKNKFSHDVAQNLQVDQLSDHTVAETIIMSVNLADGTLNQLGSKKALGFLEGRKEVKSQFLNYCLKGYQHVENNGSNKNSDALTGSDTEQNNHIHIHTSEHVSSYPYITTTSISNSDTVPQEITYNCFPELQKSVHEPDYSCPDQIKQETSFPVTCNSHSQNTESNSDSSQTGSDKNEKKSDKERLSYVESKDSEENRSTTSQEKTDMQIDFTVIKAEQVESHEESHEAAKTATKLKITNDLHQADNQSEDEFGSSPAVYKQTAHPNKKPRRDEKELFECQKCDKSFNRLQDLQTHVQCHQGNLEIQPFGCYYCQEKFNEESQLRTHLLINHCRQKQFACAYCPMVFSIQKYLQEHEKIHFGENTEVCETSCSSELQLYCKSCGITFTDDSALNRHMVLHHGEMIENGKFDKNSSVERPDVPSATGSETTKVIDSIKMENTESEFPDPDITDVDIVSEMDENSESDSDPNEDQADTDMQTDTPLLKIEPLDMDTDVTDDSQDVQTGASLVAGCSSGTSLVKEEPVVLKDTVTVPPDTNSDEQDIHIPLQPQNVNLNTSSQQDSLKSDAGVSSSDPITDYYQSLTGNQKKGILGLVQVLFKVLLRCDRSVQGTPGSEAPTNIAVTSFGTGLVQVEMKKVPLIEDKDKKFADVLVNPARVREAEVKCLSAKYPERYLLNKILDLVFTEEEFHAARGTKGLDSHKQEAVKEYMNAKSATMNIKKIEAVYRGVVQNKIGNKRNNSRPRLSKSKLEMKKKAL